MNNTNKIIDIRGLGVGLNTFNSSSLSNCPNNYALLCNPGFLELTESKCDSDCEILSFRRAVNNRYDDGECNSQKARLIIIDEYQDLITCVAKKLIRGIVSASYLCSALSKKGVVEISMPNKIISVGDDCKCFSADLVTLQSDVDLIRRISDLINDKANETLTRSGAPFKKREGNRFLSTYSFSDLEIPVHIVRSTSRDGKTILLPIYRKVVSICSSLEDHATIRYLS